MLDDWFTSVVLVCPQLADSSRLPLSRLLKRRAVHFTRRVRQHMVGRCLAVQHTSTSSKFGLSSSPTFRTSGSPDQTR